MIATTEQLNKFVTSLGGIKPELLPDKLAERGVLVSAQMAKLIAKITDKAA